VPILRRILPRLYPEMLRIAYEHQDAGRPVYIVTAAAQDLADSLAHVMAFDGAIGSHLSDVKDGVYTGHSSGAFIYGEAKAVAISALATEHGYDLSESYSYSDSASDLPMLRLVGHAVVINPDQELERLAREQGWEVLMLDPIGARLKVAAGVLAATSIAGVAAAAFQYTRAARGHGDENAQARAANPLLKPRQRRPIDSSVNWLESPRLKRLGGSLEDRRPRKRGAGRRRHKAH
jgi:hypothetical protein